MSTVVSLFPDDLRNFVDSTPWTFAKTYAATWPHEYVVQNTENAAMILALARHIFEHGTDGRFYSQVRKYHHEGGKVYWSMANGRRRPPSSIVATSREPTRRDSRRARFRNDSLNGWLAPRVTLPQPAQDGVVPVCGCAIHHLEVGHPLGPVAVFGVVIHMTT